ncbi:MAG: hypothetical protein ACRDL0_19435 [Thermoleophilaceae bacterium]
MSLAERIRAPEGGPAGELGRAARDRLADAGADVLYRESPMTHTIDPGFLGDLRGWLSAAAGTRA